MLHPYLRAPAFFVIATAMTTGLPWRASAQAIPVTLLCGTGLTPASDESCTGDMVQADSMQRFEIHLKLEETGGPKAAVAGAVVRFRASSGTIVGDPTT